jgi:hypothetical protein
MEDVITHSYAKINQTEGECYVASSWRIRNESSISMHAAMPHISSSKNRSLEHAAAHEMLEPCGDNTGPCMAFPRRHNKTRPKEQVGKIYI